MDNGKMVKVNGRYVMRFAYQKKTFGNYQAAIEFAKTFGKAEAAKVQPIGTGFGVYALERIFVPTTK